MEETSLNVATGYLSILLAYLCNHNVLKAQIASRLPGQTLGPLINAVEEFLSYHKQIDECLSHGEDEADTRAGFSRRVQALVDGLKAG